MNVRNEVIGISVKEINTETGGYRICATPADPTDIVEISSENHAQRCFQMVENEDDFANHHNHPAVY